MTIYEFCKITNTQLRVYHSPEAADLWISNVHSLYGSTSCEFKMGRSDVLLSSGCGWGKTPQDAVNDMLNNWKNKEYKIMVLNASNKSDRREFNLPDNIDGRL